jgi:hypothetical protein
MLVTLFVPTLVDIVKLTFSRHIILYRSIRQATCFFGNKVITLKLCLNKGKSPVWS